MQPFTISYLGWTPYNYLSGAICLINWHYSFQNKIARCYICRPLNKIITQSVDIFALSWICNYVKSKENKPDANFLTFTLTYVCTLGLITTCFRCSAIWWQNHTNTVCYALQQTLLLVKLYLSWMRSRHSLVMLSWRMRIRPLSRSPGHQRLPRLYSWTGHHLL